MALTLKNLTISHGDTTLVNVLSLSLKKGETLCLVGESGSGKTLTGMAIMGLLAPTLTAIADKIELDKTPLNTLSDKDMRALRGQHIGMIFQEPMTALNPVITIAAQLEEVLTTHTNSQKFERKEVMINWLNKVQLPEPERILRSYPHQLSGGQRQRICIAMALMLKPKLLIADEPTTALDVTVQAEVLSLLQSLQKEMGLTVLFITHDFGVVKKIAHRVAVLEKGHLREEGPTKSVLNAPKHDYTKKLLAAMPTLTAKKRPSSNKGKKELLRVDNLTTHFKTGSGFFKKAHTVHALTDASLSLHEGEVIGIVGESGSGKSTLVRTIAGLTTPTSGEVALSTDAVQMVFQDPFSSLNPRLTIGQNIMEGLRANPNLNIKKPAEYINNLLQECGLPEGASARYPHQFSGGQRQRVCIARALALKPKIILADEATSALDVSIQKQILMLLETLKKRYNIAFLFITHDLRVVSQFADKLIVMKDGRIVENGATGDIISTPKTDYTKRLISAA